MVVSKNSLMDHTNEALEILQTNAGFYFAQEYGLLLIQGKDAESFLQSQLTCDVKQILPGRGQYACLLDRKAHVLAYFHLYKDAKSERPLFYVLAEKRQLPFIADRLEQSRFAAQVQFSDLSNTGKFIAVEGARSGRIFGILQPDVHLNSIARQDLSSITYSGYELKVFRHSETGFNGFFLWVEEENFNQFKFAFEKLMSTLSFAELSRDDLERARVQTGTVKFEIDFDSNNLLPETGLLDKTVSYTKGCFIGQEILARVKSHGIPAQAIIGLRICGDGLLDTNLNTNSSIFVGENEIGKLKSYTLGSAENELMALAMLKRDFRVPNKTFDAQLNGCKISVQVIILPFVTIRSTKDLAYQLYKSAVQNFIKANDDVSPVSAIELLQEALILDCALEDAYEGLAVILSKHDKVDEAINIMKFLASLEPDSVMAHTNLSQFYVQKGWKELAEEEKAISLSIRMRLAAAQFAKTQEKESEQKAELLRRKEMFAQVLALDEEDFFANAGFGECLVGEGNFGQAIPYLEKAIKLKPIHLAAYLDLAKAYKDSGNNGKSREILISGIEIATKRGDTQSLQKLQKAQEES